MNSNTSDDLEEVKTSLYAGPLEEFIRNRDVLAKAHRAAGNRALADVVKAWRKPSRAAWALNMGVVSYPRVFESFDAAVADAVDAHGAAGDVRSAMTALRVAVRELAEAASIAAARGAQPVEAGTLSTAILAVLGSSEALAQLRKGCLVEIPEGGGLDALASLPTRPDVRSPTRRASSTPAPAPRDLHSEREAVRHAADAVSRLKAMSDAATQVMQAAKADLAEAEQRVREAEKILAAARKRHENAEREADVLSAELRAAEVAHAEAQKVLIQASSRFDPVLPEVQEQQ